MKKVLLDSSVWISLFANDTHTPEAEIIYGKVKNTQNTIIMPKIVYAEIVNNILRIDKDAFLLREFIYLLKTLKIKIHPLNNQFIQYKLPKYAVRVRLNTMDLLIVSCAIELQVDALYSFDVKLNRAYQYLINKLI